VAQLLVNGLIAGGIYALIAIGYTMVYGVLHFINFAHGEIVTAGAFFFYSLHVLWGWNPVFSFFLSVLLCGGLGCLIERGAYRPLRYASRISSLVTAIGVSVILQNGLGAIFGFDPKSISGSGEAVVYSIRNAFITRPQVAVLASAGGLLAGLFVFLKWTYIGTLIRATGDDLSAAVSTGIPVDRTVSVTFFVGSLLAGTAGILVGTLQDIQPTMGLPFGIKAFTAAVVGGIGSVPGAVIGGLFIGMAENLGAWIFPTGYKDAFAFLVLILFMLFRPRGILGKSALHNG